MLRMQHKLPHRISALTIAFLLFISSSGLAMDIHFCGDSFKSYNLFGKAESCHDVGHFKQKKSKSRTCCQKTEQKVVKKSCHHESEVKGNCCHNELFSLDSVNDVLNGDHSTQTAHSTNVQTIFWSSNFSLVATVKKKQNTFKYYHPPPISVDVIILHQSFLI